MELGKNDILYEVTQTKEDKYGIHLIYVDDNS